MGNAASFKQPISSLVHLGMAVSPDGTLSLVLALCCGRYQFHHIRQFVIATSVVTTISGSGTGQFADGTGTARP